MTKKDVYVTGTLLMPLAVGQRALLRQGNDLIFTSLVVEIRENRGDLICFETMNSVYHVSPLPDPVGAASLRSFLRAA